VYEGKLPDCKLQVVNDGKVKMIHIPLNSTVTIYEQNGQTFYAINNNRRLLPTG
jgi:hypothetical protein